MMMLENLESIYSRFRMEAPSSFHGFLPWYSPHGRASDDDIVQRLERHWSRHKNLRVGLPAPAR